MSLLGQEQFLLTDKMAYKYIDIFFYRHILLKTDTPIHVLLPPNTCSIVILFKLVHVIQQ